jgi:hypothetical protein
MQRLVDHYPTLYWNRYNILFPQDEKLKVKGTLYTLDDGVKPRFVPSAFDRYKHYVSNNNVLKKQKDVYRNFMNQINNTDVNLDRHDYETLLNATCKKCLQIDHLRLQLFSPFMCKVGFIKSKRLYVSDYCTAAKYIATGSYSFLTKHSIPDDRHQETFFAIDEYVELQPRESLGENVSCESFRKEVARDFFIFKVNI